MSENLSELDIVKKLLKAIDRGGDDIHMPELEQEDVDRYSDFLIEKGLVTLVRENDDTDYLQTSTTGKALLMLMHRLSQFSGEKQDMIEPEPAIVEESDWTPARCKAETEEWRNRLLLPYVLEQAEVARLEVQLKEDYDEEAMEELAQRMSRLETLENLRETMRRLNEQKLDSMFDI